MTELEILKLKAQKTTDESLESTNRMVKMTAEAKESGINSLGMLHEQGEQLDRINTGMDHIQADINEADRHIENLNKCCGLFVCPWNRRKKTIKQFDVHVKPTETRTTIPDRYNCEPPRQTTNGDGRYIQRITNDAREDAMEDNMREVAGTLSDLKNIASDMNREIKRQNNLVDDINRK
ncbi:Synaptosomal-associated protein 25, partial [Cichlidogyrus casuarinus]